MVNLINNKLLHYNLFEFCHFSFRVCYTFGKRIKFQIQEITPTFLSTGVIGTARQADHVAHSVLRNHGV